jgi:hypothetical protein
MRIIYKSCLSFIVFIGSCVVVLAQHRIQFHADILTGVSKFRSNKSQFIGSNPDIVYNDNTYCNPAAYFGVGLNFRFKRYTLGYDYYCQQYNWRLDSRMINNSTGEINNHKLVDIDYYYIKRINFGYNFFNGERWQSGFIIGYAFPAINFWDIFMSGSSTLYDAQGKMSGTGGLYMCRASGYSVSLNTGIISKNQKSKFSLTLGSEWLSNNTPNRFESDWMSMEKNTWYYSVGLRYSRLMKEWGKGK